MKFKHGTRRRALEYEKDWVGRWKDNKTFEKSVEQRPADNAYVFYDGPPFITGVPHHGTLLSSIVKDAVPRYWTMKGKRVERRWGWDCHGLPAENFVEKQLNITDRRQIIASADEKAPLDKDGNELPTITLEQYVTKARESMVASSATWEDVIDRIGRWVDFKGAYKTMDKDFMESVWWAFKELYEKGKIYEGEKVLMYDTRFATPVSKAEVTMDNDAYQTVTDPSVYVKFPVIDEKTTTYILCGGGDIKYDEFGKKLAKEITKVVVEPKILDVYFSKPEEEWRGSFNNWTDFYDKYFGKYTREMATVNDFYEQVRHADVVFFHGGQTSLLRKSLPDYEKVKEAIAGKIYVGSSAGANYIAKHALSHDDIAENSGILPLNVVVHYESDDLTESRKEHDAKKLEEAYPNEETLRIREGEFVVRRYPGVYLLAWTTTPWTLPGNLMLAVNPELTYCEVLVDGEKLIIAEEALERTLKDEKNQPIEYKIVRKYPGKELVGKRYEPLDTGSTWPENDNIHKIYAADFVSHESGTGIVHCAPAYGEDDFELAKTEGIAPFHVIDDNGYYTDSNYKGLEVWDNNKLIAKDLKEKGIVWKIEYIRHEYPFNPRSKQRIMYRAIPSWFFDIQSSKPLMLEQNENINWFPPHLKHGRFAKNIEQAPDWNLSRDRFWATAMPVWKGDKGTVKVVGSYAELKELSGVELKDYHRPWVDDITFEIDGEHFTRIDKVLDCWFESGSMPFAQLHYPFENREKFEQNYPADFIVEYIGQVRAWFYYVHVVNTALSQAGAFGVDSEKPEKNAFKNVITTGVLAGNDGRKMSKSLGNFTDPNELMDKFSADSLRFLLLGSPLLNGEDFNLLDKDVGDVARKLSMVWNMYDFFTMYAEVDGWEFDPKKPFGIKLDELTNPLDIWIISRLHQLNQQVTENMDNYNIPDAMSPILPFIDDASNWYVRRSRRRFWKSEDDGDKNDAYRTLHYVLLKLSVILAPFTPFLAEELYQKLGGGEESVHLLDWPTNFEVNEIVMNEMDLVRDYVNQALGLRAKLGLKVRQPLASVTVPSLGKAVDFEAILTDELNVKSVKVGGEVSFDETITPELKREGLMREVIRFVQSARKTAGLNVDDRIVLSLQTDDDELQKAIDEHSETIFAETLATAGKTTDNPSVAKVEGAELAISLSKTASYDKNQ
ncbi:hypothetical protein EOM60_01815 [Candidatus Saccharibacteria bacterium]|nr:hypothetical protein [Candidatus Saccharibacteria bacterium]